MSIVESELNNRHVAWGERGECGKAVRAESQFSVINILNATSTRLFSKGSWHISEEDFLSPFLVSFYVFLPLSVSLWCQLQLLPTSFPLCLMGDHITLFGFFFHSWMPNYQVHHNKGYKDCFTIHITVKSLCG